MQEIETTFLIAQLDGEGYDESVDYAHEPRSYLQIIIPLLHPKNVKKFKRRLRSILGIALEQRRKGRNYYQIIGRSDRSNSRLIITLRENSTGHVLLREKTGQNSTASLLQTLDDIEDTQVAQAPSMLSYAATACRGCKENNSMFLVFLICLVAVILAISLDGGIVSLAMIAPLLLVRKRKPTFFSAAHRSDKEKTNMAHEHRESMASPRGFEPLLLP